MDEKIEHGTKVKWGSQAGGFYTEKVGVVVAVVPPKRDPNEVLRALGEHGFLREPGMERDHESYVVRADNKRLYWPRTAALKVVKPKK